MEHRAMESIITKKEKANILKPLYESLDEMLKRGEEKHEDNKRNLYR